MTHRTFPFVLSYSDGTEVRWRALADHIRAMIRCNPCEYTWLRIDGRPEYGCWRCLSIPWVAIP